jgi:AcrR family transcriptional regulator
VSEPTIYAVFNSKRQLLLAVFNAARTGEPRDAVAKRPSSARFDTPPTVEAIAREVRRTREGGAPVARIIQAAGDADPELAQLWQEIQDERHDRMAELAQMLRAADLLREDLGLQEATDILWTLTSNDNYTHLVLERGWSPKQYERWLEGLLATSLMREDGTGA